MPRVKRGTKRNDRRKKILNRASGYFLTKSKLYQAAQEAVERGLKFAYTGRRQKKRQFRSLWIVRISAAAKLNNFSYSQLINGLKKAGIELDRKILADIAVQDAPALRLLAEKSRISSRPRPGVALGFHLRFILRGRSLVHRESCKDLGECCRIAGSRIGRQHRQITAHSGLNLALVAGDMEKFRWSRCQHLQHFTKSQARLRELAEFLTLIVVGQKASIRPIEQSSTHGVKTVHQAANPGDVVVPGEELQCRDHRHVLRDHRVQERLIDAA
jgi:large subunit ribosomal protein L20